MKLKLRRSKRNLDNSNQNQRKTSFPFGSTSIEIIRSFAIREFTRKSVNEAEASESSVSAHIAVGSRETALSESTVPAFPRAPSRKTRSSTSRDYASRPSYRPSATVCPAVRRYEPYINPADRISTNGITGRTPRAFRSRNGVTRVIAGRDRTRNATKTRIVPPTWWAGAGGRISRINHDDDLAEERARNG